MALKSTAAAAFGRLCVETFSLFIDCLQSDQPPSGGCVLKLCGQSRCANQLYQPPSGGCVLKHVCKYAQYKYACSRLRAAVC